MIAIEDPGAELAADLLAHVVLLLVQRLLLEPGDVAAVLACHIALFLPDLMVLLVQLIGLLVRQVAFLDLMVDPLVLVVQAIVHLLAAGMRPLPRRIGHCAAGHADREQAHDCESDGSPSGNDPRHGDLSGILISGSGMPRIGSRRDRRPASPNAVDSCRLAGNRGCDPRHSLMDAPTLHFTVSPEPPWLPPG